MRTIYRRALGLGLVTGLCLSVGGAAAAPPHQGSRIQYNEVARGEVSETASEENWEFTGHSGDLILIDMRADGSDLDTYLTLVDPFGNSLLTDDDSGDGLNSRIGPYRLQSDGNYMILAGRYGGAGSYLLELKNLSTIPALSPGKPLIGVVDSAHTTNYFLLDVREGDTLWRLEVIDDQSNTDPYLALYGSSGLITSTEFDGGNRIDPIVPVDGEAYVAVVSWNIDSPGGPYQLELNESDLELLDSDTPQAGSIDYSVTRQRHYFQGEAGQVVGLSVEATGNIVIALEVSTLNGANVLFSSSGESPRGVAVMLELPQTTIYVVDVWDGMYSGESGAYTISLEQVED